jgi:tRNA (cytidine56-2'-O)-methyltransferase
MKKRKTRKTMTVVIVVLRLGHRIMRDKRITTHVALSARALGASGIIMSGEKDDEVLESVNDVAERWGGDFFCEHRRDWKKVIEEYREKGFVIAHLTFYGIPVQEKVGEIRGKNALVIVGGEKVPRDVYDLADHNISVTNQPHSEVSALAIFLHEYFEGRELSNEFQNARLRIIPQERGKKVIGKEKG